MLTGPSYGKTLLDGAWPGSNCKLGMRYVQSDYERKLPSSALSEAGIINEPKCSKVHDVKFYIPVHQSLEVIGIKQSQVSCFLDEET